MKPDKTTESKSDATRELVKNEAVLTPLEDCLDEKSVRELLANQRCSVNSVAAGLLGVKRGTLIGEMSNARFSMLQFYQSKFGGEHSPEEAQKC